MTETTETNQPQLDKSVKINPTENQIQPSETACEPTPNPCQGYQVDPLTKLHLCQVCSYHQYRNEIKVLFFKKGF
jgi:hypothetical protein